MFESANALRANGLRPLIGIIRPAPVNNPILIKSRRLTCPWECALMISQRFFRAFSASRNRAFEALGDKKKLLSGMNISLVGELSRRSSANDGTESGVRPSKRGIVIRFDDHPATI